MAETETRKLAAIMFTDMVGFSRQMGADEARTLRLLAVHNQVIHQAANAHKGMVIKTVDDAFLVDFPSVVHAVQCAQQVQAQLRAHNAEKEDAEQIHIRIGIHLGDIVQQNGDVFGDGFNIAKRLQELTEADTICISQKVYYEQAVAEMERAVAINPNEALSYASLAEVLSVVGRADEALRAAEQALRLKPLVVDEHLTSVGVAYALAGRYADCRL